MMINPEEWSHVVTVPFQNWKEAVIHRKWHAQHIRLYIPSKDKDLKIKPMLLFVLNSSKTVAPQ